MIDFFVKGGQIMKKLFKILGLAIGCILAAALLLVAYLSITEFKPEAIEPAAIEHIHESESLKAGSELDILIWNIGYSGLGKDSDFFMDGGENVKSADKATVERNLDAMANKVKNLQPDILMLQEVDIDSSRSYGIDQRKSFAFGESSHALNYACDFVPFPLPPIGKVHSGVMNSSVYEVSAAERHALPCPFSWPVSAANLKRCLLVNYLPIEGSDKQLVMINLHLEAYDDGEGKIAQTNQLRELMLKEYGKGNHVIAGGDFNQSFPNALDTYPNTHPELWTPGILDNSLLPEGWSYAYDLETPSCRLLNKPYDPADTKNTQHYVIDGFILSPNVELKSVETLDLGFEFSDHNPVNLKAVLN